LDFLPGGDHTDLNSFHADPSVSDTFHWTGKNSFDHKYRGELRYSAGLLQADVNGDGLADFEVALQNGTALAKSDILAHWA
jgi:serralysin